MTTSQTYFTDMALSTVDVSKIYFGRQVKGESKTSTSITYDRVPIKYQAGAEKSDTDQVLSFEVNTEGKINTNAMGDEKNYTMILRTVTPTATNIAKLDAIEKRIQELAREQKIPLKNVKSVREKFVDPEDLIILRRNKHPQGAQQNPVVFARIYSENGIMNLGTNFRKLNTKETYERTNGKCGIHKTADPHKYLADWVNLIAVVKVAGLFVGTVQNIQVKLNKAIIINKIKKEPLINLSIKNLMPTCDDASDDDDDSTSQRSESNYEGSSDEATISILCGK